MPFINPEARWRHKFIDDTMSNTYNLLNNQTVIKYMGQNAINDIVESLDNCFVPNIYNGKVKTNKIQVENNNIPIIALSVGEKVGVESKLMLPTLPHFDKLVSFIGINSLHAFDVDSIVEYILDVIKRREVYELKYKSDIRAYVSSLAASYKARESHNEYNIAYTRPYLVLQSKPGNMNRQSPGTLVHELTHVTQTINSPCNYIGQGDDGYKNWRYREELEAYHIQANFERGLAEFGYIPAEGELQLSMKLANGRLVSNAIHIDDLRIGLNANRPKDSYYPHPILKQTYPRLT